MKEILLAAMVSFGNPVPVKIDLAYAPCRALYEKAVKSQKPSDMRYVEKVCRVIEPSIRGDE